MARNIFVGESTEEAFDFALNSAFGQSFDYLIRLIGPGRLDGWKEDPDMPDEEVTAEYAVRRLAIVGDPEECTTPSAGNPRPDRRIRHAARHRP